VLCEEARTKRYDEVFYLLCRTLDETLELVKDIFSSAGERDIYTGDFVDIQIITKDGIKYEQFPLKKD
jgi:20S proteasome subunit beta 6